MHIDLHVQSANAGTIGQWFVTQGPPLQAGQTQTVNMRKQNTFPTSPQGTAEKIVTVPGDHLPLPVNHTPSPLAPWTSTTVNKTCF